MMVKFTIHIARNVVFWVPTPMTIILLHPLLKTLIFKIKVLWSIVGSLVIDVEFEREDHDSITCNCDREEAAAYVVC
jgi:hypothetical protein